MSPKLENSMNSKVVGVTFNDLRSGLNRQKIIASFIRPGAKLEARLEPENKHDPNAVALWYVKGILFWKSEYHIGYMTKTINERMANLLRQGKDIEIRVTEVTESNAPERTKGVNIEVSY